MPWVHLEHFVGPSPPPVHHYTFLEGTSTVTDILLLISSASSFVGCDYLEIGSRRGESLLHVLPYCQSCYSLSLSEEELKSMKVSEEFLANEGLLVKNEPRIVCIRHNSMTFDFSTLNKKFDLIFIDGDHSYEAIYSDTKNAFTLLKNEKSVIVWHDCGYT